MSDFQYPSVEHIQKATKLQDVGVIEAFIETLKWLDEKAPPQFDGLPGRYEFHINEVMSSFEDHEGEHTTCGTVCCIAGAAMLYQAKGNFEKANSMCLLDYVDADQELDKLFFPVTGRSHNALAASRALRHYLFTGRVSWNTKAGMKYNGS